MVPSIFERKYRCRIPERIEWTENMKSRFEPRDITFSLMNNSTAADICLLEPRNMDDMANVPQTELCITIWAVNQALEMDPLRPSKRHQVDHILEKFFQIC